MDVQMSTAMCVCVGAGVQGLLNSWIGGWLRADRDIYFAMMDCISVAAAGSTTVAGAACWLLGHTLCALHYCKGLAVRRYISRRELRGL